MKERPILLSAPMVRAILDGRKTQTRRIINEKTLKVDVRGTVRGDFLAASTVASGRCKAHIAKYGAVSALAQDGRMLGVKPGEFDFVCPYADGETILENLGNDKSQWRVLPKASRLWVRETFRVDDFDPEQTIYTADVPADVIRDTKGIIKCKPSIFMPRNRSRITLEIESVRVERLNDISEEDARAEGVEPVDVMGCANGYRDYGCDIGGVSSPRLSFQTLWESINGPGSWSSNPWTWAITFKRITP